MRLSIRNVVGHPCQRGHHSIDILTNIKYSIKYTNFRDEKELYFHFTSCRKSNAVIWPTSPSQCSISWHNLGKEDPSNTQPSKFILALYFICLATPVISSAPSGVFLRLISLNCNCNNEERSKWIFLWLSKTKNLSKCLELFG